MCRTQENSAIKLELGRANKLFINDVKKKSRPKIQCIRTNRMSGQNHPNMNMVKRNGMAIILVLYGKEERKQRKDK